MRSGSKGIFSGVFRSIGFLADYVAFKRASALTTKRFTLAWRDRNPRMNEKVPTFGFDRHYVYHPAWAARVLARVRPSKHVDISSSLFFNAFVSAFIPVEFYEYRPADLHLSQFSSHHADIAHLPFADNSVESLSCMHVVEHIGLGRYGDPIDPDGDLKAMQELSRVLAPGGTLLFVVPVGKQKIEFNAHRLYTYHSVVESFPDLILKEFSFISDQSSRGGIIDNPPEEIKCGNEEGCGCFWFTK